jgi:PPOX class probable F420-dependent enzyme
MTDFPDSHRDLLEAKTFVEFATLAPSGHPQVTEVAFLYDEGALRVSLNETRVKVRNLRRDPRCTLFILDPEDDLRYLEVRADAELAPDRGGQFAAKIGAKYGLDFAQYDQPGEERVVVTLRPVKVNAIPAG